MTIIFFKTKNSKVHSQIPTEKNIKRNERITENPGRVSKRGGNVFVCTCAIKLPTLYIYTTENLSGLRY